MGRFFYISAYTSSSSKEEVINLCVKKIWFLINSNNDFSRVSPDSVQTKMLPAVLRGAPFLAQFFLSTKYWKTLKKLLEELSDISLSLAMTTFLRSHKISFSVSRSMKTPPRSNFEPPLASLYQMWISSAARIALKFILQILNPPAGSS